MFAMDSRRYTVDEEYAILLYRRDHTMMAYGKIYFEAQITNKIDSK